MIVTPTGSMQKLLVEALEPGEGHLSDGSDIAFLKVLATDPEGETNHVKVTALVRLFGVEAKRVAKNASGV